MNHTVNATESLLEAFTASNRSSSNVTAAADSAAAATAAAANFEDLTAFKYYSEGVVLTPISVFGIIGENKISIHVSSLCTEEKYFS